MSLRDRISFGAIGTFVPTGKVVRLGPQSAAHLGKVEEWGEAQTIKIVVGQNKGKLARNTSGRCAIIPEKFSAEDIDRRFVGLRNLQVGKENVGATRVKGDGWYEGDPEHSVAYEIAFIPNPKEPTFAEFQENINELALELAEMFCQDSVLILRDDGTRKTVAGAKWDP